MLIVSTVQFAILSSRAGLKPLSCSQRAPCGKLPFQTSHNPSPSCRICAAASAENFAFTDRTVGFFFYDRTNINFTVLVGRRNREARVVCKNVARKTVACLLQHGVDQLHHLSHIYSFVVV